MLRLDQLFDHWDLSVAQKQKNRKEKIKPVIVNEKYIGSYIEGDLGGVPVSNPHLVKYYGKMIKPAWKSKT